MRYCGLMLLLQLIRPTHTLLCYVVIVLCGQQLADLQWNSSIVWPPLHGEWNFGLYRGALSEVAESWVLALRGVHYRKFEDLHTYTAYGL